MSYKKYIFFILSTFLIFCLSSPIFATENKVAGIKSVVYSAEDNSLSLSTYTSEGVDKVFVMVSEYKEDTLYSTDNIAYFNSFSTADSRNNTFILKLSDLFNKNNYSYVIRLGANGIEKADYMLLFSDSNKNGAINKVYFGDVDNNGVINNDDVKLAMDYVRNSDNSAFNYESLKRADIDFDRAITSTDVVHILRLING